MSSAKDTFQKKLKENTPKVKQSPNVFVLADKTSNIYESPEQQYKKTLHNKVRKTYKKAPPKLEMHVHLEAKNIAKLTNLNDCIKCIARKSTFITLRACVPYFLSNFYFSPNDSSSKTMKMFIYFI